MTDSKKKSTTNTLNDIFETQNDAKASPRVSSNKSRQNMATSKKTTTPAKTASTAKKPAAKPTAVASKTKATTKTTTKAKPRAAAKTTAKAKPKAAAKARAMAKPKAATKAKAPAKNKPAKQQSVKDVLSSQSNTDTPDLNANSGYPVHPNRIWPD